MMKVLLDSVSLQRTIKRMTHEIIERNDDLSNIVLVGIKNKGVPISKMICENLLSFEGVNVMIEEIDISSYRDDKKIDGITNNFKNDINNKIVILIDDVLQSGRTVRSAIDAIIELGRPIKIQLAVLVDRGHKELPIRADFVGKNIPTNINEKVIFDVDTNNVYIK